jgi:hypothetical protein
MPLRWIMRQGAKGKSFPLVFRRKDCTEAPGAGLRPAGAQKKRGLESPEFGRGKLRKEISFVS